jgi:hypothetical protein
VFDLEACSTITRVRYEANDSSPVSVGVSDSGRRQGTKAYNMDWVGKVVSSKDLHVISLHMRTLWYAGCTFLACLLQSEAGMAGTCLTFDLSCPTAAEQQHTQDVGQRGNSDVCKVYSTP